jgi:hypothetical protein
VIDEERTVTVAAPPRGSRFKGYTSFVVQDLMIRPHVVNFRCERWQAPDGGMVTAPLPAGIDEWPTSVFLLCRSATARKPLCPGLPLAGPRRP